VWSVWSKTINVYLGQGVAMLQVDDQETMLLRSPATLPMARILSKMTELANKEIFKHSAIQVSLSGAWCPAFNVTIPEGVTRWHERQQIARASGAKVMGIESEQIACEMTATQGLAAAISLPILQEVQAWTTGLGCRLKSVSPLWTTATQCEIARRSSTKAVLLSEPDGSTLLIGGEQGSIKVVNAPGVIGALDFLSQSPRILMDHGLSEESTLKIGFDSESRTSIQGGPKRWARHWYLA
jgi:hypothetical protein